MADIKRILSDEEIRNKRPPNDGYAYYQTFGEAIAKAQRDLTLGEVLAELESISGNPGTSTRLLRLSRFVSTLKESR